MKVHHSSRLGVLWHELKKRKVFQVALVYVLMSWGIMQVGELLFEALQVPDNAYTLLVILILLGFPVAVVLAWAYEITPDGVRRDIVRELRMQNSNCSSNSPFKIPQETNARIAIMPLRDMAPGHDLSYFCDGLAEEIQNALCITPGLDVIARAHSFQFGGKKIDMAKIRSELQATAIIAGSVRHCQNTFRISVQLVDVSTSLDIWSRSHEVSLKNEFAVQKRVAAEVAHNIAETLSREHTKSSSGEQMRLDYPGQL